MLESDGIVHSKLALPINQADLELIADLFSNLGTADFLASAWRSFRAAFDFSAGGVILFFKDKPPKKILLTYSNEARGALSEDGYFLGPYALDPIYIMFANGCKNGVYKISDSSEIDFEGSEFYKTFYYANKIVDSIDIIWNFDENSAVLIFFEREIGEREFSESELMLANWWSKIAFSAMQRHFLIMPMKNDGEIEKLFHDKVQVAIKFFGSSLLTAREMEVLSFMFKGYSVSKTAMKLGIAESTVKIHRNSIHQKLEVSSQTELFSLLIQSIPYASVGDPGDPLVAQRFSPKPTAGVIA